MFCLIRVVSTRKDILNARRLVSILLSHVFIDSYYTSRITGFKYSNYAFISVHSTVKVCEISSKILLWLVLFMDLRCVVVKSTCCNSSTDFNRFP